MILAERFTTQTLISLSGEGLIIIVLLEVMKHEENNCETIKGFMPLSLRYFDVVLDVFVDANVVWNY